MFRFSMRDLMWLLMVLGLFFAWTMDCQRMASQEEQVRQVEQKLSAKQDALNRVTDSLRREVEIMRMWTLPISSAAAPNAPKP
jgi:hypothetical protein